MILFLSGLILLSAVLHIRAEYAANLRQIFFFKPTTTLLIILVCFLQAAGISSGYYYFVLAGLLFSLGGDVFLMLPSDRFLHGLLSFLCAHVIYILAFSRDYGFQIHIVYLLPMFVLGAGLLTILLPHTGTMTLPVIVYIIIITAMAWQAIERWGIAHTPNAGLAAVGAILFVVSDAILAYDRFVKPFQFARVLVLATYYLAQWGIAMSVA